MIFRPTESSKKIVDTYRRYLLTTFTTNNDRYNSQIKELLNQPKAISDGPYISISDPYEKSVSMQELMDEGIISTDFSKLKILPRTV